MLVLVWSAGFGISAAQAHLLAAQKGTLNLVGDAAFMVLSVPASALRGVDDDGDGALSSVELGAHAGAIEEQVQAGVQLLDAGDAAPLRLLMLDRAPAADGRLDAAASHLLLLGRFQLPTRQGDAVDAGGPPAQGLALRFTLFGTGADEQVQDWTITRQQETHWLRFVKGRDTQALLPGPWTVWIEYIAAGAYHVISGVDHVLFLLLVLSAARSIGSVLGALSCFTLGHAVTLFASAWGAVSVSERIVEPAIAATIIGLAIFDAWARKRGWTQANAWRLVLVFLCAMVHGLGLAGALTDLTQWLPGSLSWNLALAGFNVGIELAQVGVAAAVAVLTLTLRALRGHSSTSNR